MSTATRVAGHTLRSEGAPYERRPDGSLWRLPPYGGVSGTGRALCSCGVYGPVMSSAKQRKHWHRMHKAAH